MATVTESRPQPRKGTGSCLGRGCLIFIVLIVFLGLAGVYGLYVGARKTFTSTEPRALPEVQTSPEQQQAVKDRWENFKEEAAAEQPPLPSTTPLPPNETPTPTPIPTATAAPAQPTIQFSAGDINQLIAANRKARGHAYVSIVDNVGHVEVSIPLDKLGFKGRFLNADFVVRAAPDGSPSGIQIETKAPGGTRFPERIFNYLAGVGRVRVYIDRYINDYRDKYDVKSFRIIDNKAVIEAGRPNGE